MTDEAICVENSLIWLSLIDSTSEARPNLRTNVKNKNIYNIVLKINPSHSLYQLILHNCFFYMSVFCQF